MIHLGMLEGEMHLPSEYVLFEKRWRVNPSVGGYLIPHIPASDLGRDVRRGEILGRVFSPYTFELVEELLSPCDGIVFYAPREYPVRPGDWAYGIIDRNDENTRWVDNPLSNAALQV